MKIWSETARQSSSYRFRYFSTTERTPVSANTGSSIPSFEFAKSGISENTKSFRKSSPESGLHYSIETNKTHFLYPTKALQGNPGQASTPPQLEKSLLPCRS